jgi:hypothetical protein
MIEGGGNKDLMVGQWSFLCLRDWRGWRHQVPAFLEDLDYQGWSGRRGADRIRRTERVMGE